MHCIWVKYAPPRSFWQSSTHCEDMRHSLVTAAMELQLSGACTQENLLEDRQVLVEGNGQAVLAIDRSNSEREKVRPQVEAMERYLCGRCSAAE